jgi:hypothetical protein
MRRIFFFADRPPMIESPPPPPSRQSQGTDTGHRGAEEVMPEGRRRRAGFALSSCAYTHGLLFNGITPLLLLLCGSVGKEPTRQRAQRSAADEQQRLPLPLTARRKRYQCLHAGKLNLRLCNNEASVGVQNWVGIFSKAHLSRSDMSCDDVLKPIEGCVGGRIICLSLIWSLLLSPSSRCM